MVFRASGEVVIVFVYSAASLSIEFRSRERLNNN